MVSLPDKLQYLDIRFPCADSCSGMLCQTWSSAGQKIACGSESIAPTGERESVMPATPLQAFSIVAGFSALSAWYGYMFGKESARKELEERINELRDLNNRLKNGVDVK
ncbi:hypothetical protein AXG93_1335s1330 [Marchantia polymorpha subsp. ruderalis]|uniref:Uncharacterized protein n=3 Tax=Marchantia polymorpha TaxID=3197 RepID=A0A176W7P1_MARPO|nr:hypothetical protein AXG93_1335s1330 [Marchantia polymorpha subsp. ruderalis]